MVNSALTVAVVIGVALFMILLCIGNAAYAKMNKNMVSSRLNPNEWLLSDFHLKVYDFFFGKKTPEEAAVKLGIDVEKYLNGCRLVGRTPDLKKLVAHYIYGIFSLIVCAVLGVYASAVFYVIGLGLFVYFVFYERRAIDSKAEEMRIQVENELPRFMGLLKAEIEVGFPVETAVILISERFDSLLSDEFRHALNEMQLGVSGWAQAMEKVAVKYDVDTLSDFVLDITTAYKKGVSVVASVERKTEEIKETHLLAVKERSQKVANFALFPIAIFQFMPMIAYMLIPVFLQSQSMSVIM